MDTIINILEKEEKDTLKSINEMSYREIEIEYSNNLKLLNEADSEMTKLKEAHLKLHIRLSRRNTELFLFTLKNTQHEN